MFKLLEVVSHSEQPDIAYIKMFDKKWVIREYERLPDAPDFSCISYVWGDGTTQNPLNHEQIISTRTIAAIEAVIHKSCSQQNWANNIKFNHNRDTVKEEAGQIAALKASQAFWVDALCVPIFEPERTDCLRSMGEIFSAAFQVFVVLAPQSSALIQMISRAEQLSLADILTLEKERWVDRAWTYQEAVNSRYLYFVAEDEEKAMISGNSFLSAIASAIKAYKTLHHFDKLTWVDHHPKLNSLEILLADYLISDYQERSAYQVMSVMGQRNSERPEDYFYAMVGSITNTSVKVEGDELLAPAEYFMRVCERKGDYSFIYSTEQRSKNFGKSWRPVEGKLTAVLPNLTTLGAAEIGSHDTIRLKLCNMFRLNPGSINDDGLKAARWFMATDSDGLCSAEIASGVLKRLRSLGFTGCGEYLEYETGFFFPQRQLKYSEDVFATVSCDIHWVTGGPGLLLSSSSADINNFRDVGAFVGRSPKVGETTYIG